MRIAVDTGGLADGGGIGRYLSSLLGEMLESTAGEHEWLLYGRTLGRPGRPAGPTLATVRCRADRFPPHTGRIASLFTSSPYWAARDSPDVFWGPAHRLPGWLPRRTARVVTVHDLCWKFAPQAMRPVTRWLDATLMPASVRQADRILAVSHATGAQVAESFPDVAGRIVVVSLAAAPLPAPCPLDRLAALGVRVPYVLVVGTLEPRKNLRRLLQAFAILPSSLREGTQLVFAGPAGWGDAIDPSDVAALGIEDRVRMLGRVADDVLASLYRHACFLAMPSLYEGFGLPLVEAMSQGTPVLASSVASLLEVAGEAGLLVDPLDVDSIAAGLARMLGEAGLRDRLASRAASQAARYSWARAARETLSVFEAAVSARRRRA
jgi:glycosyltransferase involved in cell wall biosynthesis